MRITGGAWASRRVAGPPRGVDVRPTPDALREQAFAVLRPHLAGAGFLDLFAGTGVVSLEALSRGAARAVAVERDGRCVAVIRRNAETLAVDPERLKVYRGEALATIGRLGVEGVACDLAWCDPPFAAWGLGADALVAARIAGVIRAGALAVIEVPDRRSPEIPGFEVVRALRGALLVRAS